MKPTTLDLKVPRGWQQCSTRELEMIAEEMIRSQMMASLSRFRPFDWTEIKTRLFFRFAEVEVTDMVEDEYENDVFICRHPSLGKTEFPLQTWQVHSFLDQLKWLDATDAKGRPLPMPKMMWPYPERLWRLRWKRWKPEKDYYRPGELLDGLSWAQYRLANDWMEAYTMKSNAIVAEREKGAKGSGTSAPQLKQMQREERDIRLTVLSLMFGCPKWRIRLARISEVEWQVVMFWWSSMMQYLKEQYPKCFKSSAKPSRSRQPLPIELYTRSMATLQKYLGGLTEDEINAQTAHAILRHLNDMALEAEEMEKLRRKHK